MGVVMRMGITFSFESAHKLTKVPPDHKCRRLHGHSYRGEVTISGETDERHFVMDYAELRDHIIGPLVEKVDHQNINEVLNLETTSENLCGWFAQRIHHSLPEGVTLERVRLWETARGFSEWVPGCGFP